MSKKEKSRESSPYKIKTRELKISKPRELKIETRELEISSPEELKIDKKQNEK